MCVIILLSKIIIEKISTSIFGSVKYGDTCISYVSPIIILADKLGNFIDKKLQ